MFENDKKNSKQNFVPLLPLLLRDVEKMYGIYKDHINSGNIGIDKIFLKNVCNIFNILYDNNQWIDNYSKNEINKTVYNLINRIPDLTYTDIQNLRDIKSIISSKEKIKPIPQYKPKNTNGFRKRSISLSDGYEKQKCTKRKKNNALVPNINLETVKSDGNIQVSGRNTISIITYSPNFNPNCIMWKNRDIKKWLHNLDLSSFYKNFKDNKINGQNLLYMSKMDDKMLGDILILMGVTKVGVIITLKIKIKEMFLNYKDVDIFDNTLLKTEIDIMNYENWDIDIVKKWLGIINMDTYDYIFETHQITGKCLKYLNTNIYYDIMGINIIGHRLHIMHEIDKIISINSSTIKRSRKGQINKLLKTTSERILAGVNEKKEVDKQKNITGSATIIVNNGTSITVTPRELKSTIVYTSTTPRKTPRLR